MSSSPVAADKAAKKCGAGASPAGCVISTNETGERGARTTSLLQLTKRVDNFLNFLDEIFPATRLASDDAV